MSGFGEGLEMAVKPPRRFQLFMRCEGCRRESVRVLVVPAVEEAPEDIDDLLESTVLQRQVFSCPSCQGSIAALTGVTMLDEMEAV